MNPVKNILITIIFALLSVSLWSQGDALFQDEIVHEIRITIDDAAFWPTLTSNYDDNYPNVPYVMANATIDGNEIDSIGVRLKGFSSYWVDTNKKLIKLDFNEYVSGQKYDGLDSRSNFLFQ